MRNSIWCSKEHDSCICATYSEKGKKKQYIVFISIHFSLETFLEEKNGATMILTIQHNTIPTEYIHTLSQIINTLVFVWYTVW